MKKLLFLSIIFIFILTNCGGPDQSADSGNGRDAEVSEENIAEEAVDEEIHFSEAPELDLGGQEFVIMVTPWSIPIWNQRDIFSEGEIGEVFNDALFRRNMMAEEKYNITITERVSDNLESDIRRFVSAGDSSIDALTPRLRAVSGLSTSGSIVEFGQLTHIDLNKPWWDSHSAEALSVTGKLFAVCSDITVMDNDSTSALVFNKQLLAEYNLDDPYQMVRSGVWTLDKLQELTKTVSADLNGDGVMDDLDRYGLLYQRDTMTSFLTGAGEFVAAKDSGDVPVMTLNNPKALEVLDYLYDFLYDDNYCFHVMKFFDPKGIDFTAGMTAMFENNQALFMWIRMADVQNLRAMDTDFGILPIPKWNDSQDDYLHNVNPHVGTVTAVPRSAGNIEAASAVLDTLAGFSRYILIPAYYDVQLTTQLTRDEESTDMLDIIFSNRRYDIGDIYDFGGLGNEVIYMSMTAARDIVSRFDRMEPRAVTAIERLVEAYEGLE